MKILHLHLFKSGVRVKIWFQNRRARDRREQKDPNGIKQSIDNNETDEDDQDVIVS